MMSGPGIGVGADWYPIHRSTMRIGRRGQRGLAPDVDLGPFDPQRLVSRRHAEMTLEDGVVHLRDLGSRNGTTVNGVSVGRVARRLDDGDELGFANVAARFARDAPWPDGLRADRAQPGAALQEPTVVGRRGALIRPAPRARAWWRRLAWWK
jgi:predicted component of type VI protein secretion system